MARVSRLGGAYVGISADTKQFDRRTREAARKFGRFGKRIGDDNRRIRRSFRRTRREFSLFSGALSQIRTAAAGFLTVWGAFSAGRTFANFEQSMAGVAAVSGATAEQFSALEAQALSLGRSTSFSASEVAEAQRFLSMAGFEVNQTLASTASMLDLARVGMLDLGRAADIASNTLSGFGIDANKSRRVVDVFAKTVTSANTDVEQLGDALSYVGPVASALGVSLEETSAAIAVLSNRGIQGSRAGTGLRRVFADLVSPSAALTSVLGDMGLSLADVNPRVVGFVQALEALRGAGMTAAQAFQGFGKIAAPAIVALVGNTDEVKEMKRELEGAAGASRVMARILDDTLRGAFLRLKSAAEGLTIATFKEFSDDLRELVEGLARGLNVLTDNIGRIRAAFEGFGDILKIVAATYAAIWGAKAVASVVAGGMKIVGVLRVLAGANAAVAASSLIAAAASRGLLTLGVGGALVGLEYLTKGASELEKIDKQLLQIRDREKMLSGFGISDAGKAKAAAFLAAERERLEALRKTASDEAGPGVVTSAVNAVMGAAKDQFDAFWKNFVGEVEAAPIEVPVAIDVGVPVRRQADEILRLVGAEMKRLAAVRKEALSVRPPDRMNEGGIFTPDRRWLMLRAEAEAAEKAISDVRAEMEAGSIGAKEFARSHAAAVARAARAYGLMSDRAKDLRDEQAAVSAIMEANRTPGEKLRERLAQIEALYRSGALSMEEYTRATKRLTQGMEAIKSVQERLADGAREMAGTFTSAIERMVFEAGSLRDVLGGLLRDLARIVLRKSILDPLGGMIASAIGSSFGGAMAAGGPVQGRNSYLVGERGPELFVPRGGGNIIPHHQLPGRGALTVNNTFNIQSSDGPGVRAALEAAIPLIVSTSVRRAEESVELASTRKSELRTALG